MLHAVLPPSRRPQAHGGAGDVGVREGLFLLMFGLLELLDFPFWALLTLERQEG